MRVSERQRYWLANKHVDEAKEKNIEALNVLSSQKRINDLHDDPVGAARAIKHRDVISDYDSFRKNIDFSKGFVEVTETAVNSISERLSRAHELSIAMANDTYAVDSRRATAKEIKEIKNQVIQMANSKYNGRYIFSGFRTTSSSLDMDGNYLGDDGSIFLQIGHDMFKQVNIPGRSLFEANADEKTLGHLNMVNTLGALEDALNADDRNMIYKLVEELSFQLEKTNSFQSSIGSVAQALGEAEKRIELSSELEVKTLSGIEDADIYNSSSDFKRAETVLQSTLLASSKFLQPSLLNFLQ